MHGRAYRQMHLHTLRVCTQRKSSASGLRGEQLDRHPRHKRFPDGSWQWGGGASYVPAGGVYAVFRIKPRLSRHPRACGRRSPLCAASPDLYAVQRMGSGACSPMPHQQRSGRMTARMELVAHVHEHFPIKGWEEL